MSSVGASSILQISTPSFARGRREIRVAEAACIIFAREVAIDKTEARRFRALTLANVRLAKAKMRLYTIGMTMRAILDAAAGHLSPDLAHARMRDSLTRISISRIG